MLKKLAVVLMVLGLAFGLMVSTTRESRFEVSSSRRLHVSPEQAWSVLSRVGDWPAWWPGVVATQLAGGLVAGAQIELQMKGTPSAEPARLMLVDPTRELVWERPGVLGSSAGTGFRLEREAGVARLSVVNFVRGPQAFLARATGRDAFLTYQEKLLDAFERYQLELAEAGEKD